ncbi:MAG: 50S ribosomal protein L25/general stress protein Ctc [Gammaproteobacteria bacterium RIFCSPHIGHO2_12_FULL_35_23]|nr:MAG: 50S ribosomal protein L25/general stress protein Ctc [Gammaproteobacteria bacterium RIFCSPHIGHO2_12_FULL_35_23]
MSEIYELTAEVREVRGTSANRRLRREENLIPAVIYGAKEAETVITLSHNTVKHALENEAFFSRILTLNVGKKKEQVILKAVQRHPYKPNILHLDFLRIKADEKLQMNVPIHFINEDKAPGIRNAGVVTHHFTEIKISCLPANLPEYIEVDLANLELNQSIHLSQLSLPNGVELMDLSGDESQDHTVVHIHPPRAVEEEIPVTPPPETIIGTKDKEASVDDEAESDNNKK